MKKYHESNVRIRHKYRFFLKEAKRYSEASLDAVDKAIARFEEYNGYKDFKRFHYKQATGFKNHLLGQKNQQTGKPLSKSTLNATLNNLKAFFQWLCREPGYKSRLEYSDAEFFNLSEKDTRIANAKREKRVPTLEQVCHVIKQMPSGNQLEMRDRALIAFTILTGARDRAIASLKLKHIDLTNSLVVQDAREVDTKFSKTFETVFFPVGQEVQDIVIDWVEYLRKVLLWGENDPLFPATASGLDKEGNFCSVGIRKAHWKNADPIRRIFRKGFENAGLPYYNPHSFRDTLVSLGQKLCETAEQFKAWSQNLGHEQVITTLTSYGHVSIERQRMLISEFSERTNEEREDIKKALKELLKKY
jgi:integrase/recombinase XerD